MIKSQKLILILMKVMQIRLLMVRVKYYFQDL